MRITAAKGPNGSNWTVLKGLLTGTVIIFLIGIIFAAGGAWVRIEAAEAAREADKITINEKIDELKGEVDDGFQDIGDRLEKVEDRLFEKAEEEGELKGQIKEVLRLLRQRSQ